VIRDLPGQGLLFDERELGDGGRAEGPKGDALRVLADGLPDKATVSVPEAAAIMHCCRRTVEYWIADGTLLATYANRSNDPGRKHARIIVRSGREYDPGRKELLTLAELRVKRSNVGGN
jgi:hypothetical protein